MSDPFYHDAALYDAMYADVAADLPLLVALAKAAGGPVLELACGSGRVLLPLLEAGVDADGLDLSREMLDGLRGKLAARGFGAGVHEADMRAFALPRRYARVLIAFNSFLHNLTQEAQLDTLRCCRAHLAPDGRLVMIVFHPSVDGLANWTAGEKVVKNIPNVLGPGRVRVRDLAVDERVEQVRHVTRHVDFLDERGDVVRTVTVPFSLRYVFKPEMELLLRTAGFARWTVEPLDGDATTGAWRPAAREAREGDMMLWTAWSEPA